MPVALPHALTDGTTAYGSQVRANDNALAAKFTEGAGGIADADVASGAAIKGTKLSNVAGNRVPTDRIEDDAITDAKLRDDAAVDANRAVTTNHIRDQAVTKGKVAVSTLTHSQLQMLVQVTAFGPHSPGGTVGSVTATIEVSGANYVVRLYGTLVGGGAAWDLVVNPSPAIPTATRSPLAIYLQSVTGIGSTAVSGGINITHIAIS